MSFDETETPKSPRSRRAVATALVMAYNKWFTGTVLGRDSRIKAMLNLPIDDPDATLETIR